MFAMGRPFMPPVKFPAKIDSFLESIWNKYGKTSLIGLEKLIKSNSAFKENCIAGTINVIDLKAVVDSFIKSSKAAQKNNAFSNNRKKLCCHRTDRSWFPNGSLVKSTYNPKGDDYEQIS